ncbi:hypothetical protein [Hyphomonas sp.]|uniref:hypothetical protein n=1 Tax=Hyphomonas sp. TaxID=87 RepID=UPI0025C6787F|nr:hypothetical protein [Hyphomonas sp.]MBI1401274.1 hypothetical protein [Hyphomonas sp.]
MTLENTTNIELRSDDTAQVTAEVAAEPVRAVVATPPGEPPRKRYAAPSAPRVMQFMRAPADKA